MIYKELAKYTKDLILLYAEDDVVIAEINEDLFKLLFKEVVLVHNGLEAIKEYENKKFDLVILDIEMPLMNGLDAGKKIRLIEPNQKIIFLTAFDEIEYLKTALDIRANEYILKPLKIDEFLEKIYNLASWKEF